MAYDIKADKNPLSINIRKLQRYNFEFFSLEEVVFFEYIVVKAPLFKYKEFFHSTSTIEKEIGIKRSKLDSIIIKFSKLGILTVEVKGFPKVKHFTVNFQEIEKYLSKIYQSAENGKLSAEMSKLLVDYYKPLVDSYNKKYNIKETIKESLKEKRVNDSGFDPFNNIFFEKINEYKNEFKLSEASIQYTTEALYSTYKTYGDETLDYFNKFIRENKHKSKIVEFLKPLTIDSTKNNFIENSKNQNKIDGKNLIDVLSNCFNDRRRMASTDKKKYSETTLLANPAIIEKAAKCLSEMTEHQINIAFIAYSDAIIGNKVQPNKILPYFFTNKYGCYVVIEEYLDYFSVHYSQST
jgi:hypothetical protein